MITKFPDTISSEKFCTSDFGERVFFGDLLLHLLWELLFSFRTRTVTCGTNPLFSFCTTRDRPGTKTEIIILHNKWLHIEKWGFSLHHVSDYREGTPRSTRPWTDTCDVQVSTTWRLLPLTEDSEGADTHRSSTDSTEQWVWFLMHMWSMLHVISVIFFVWGPPQKALAVFGYIEVSCERYTPNIYRCIHT
jgi:hypothetical protein